MEASKRAVYLVRKVIEGEPLLVLGVIAGFAWRNGRSEKHIGPLIEELARAASLPGPTVFISLEGEHSFLLNKFSQILGARILPATDAVVEYRA